jgi:hypothetical protein
MARINDHDSATRKERLLESKNKKAQTVPNYYTLGSSKTAIAKERLRYIVHIVGETLLLLSGKFFEEFKVR